MAAVALSPQLVGHVSGPASLTRDLARAGLWGCCWGVAARIWMRFISSNPEFSVSGSAYIVAAPTAIALCSVLAIRCLRWRPAFRRPARGVAAFSTLLLGMAAGILMFPTIALGAIAYGQRTWPRPARVAIASLASLPIVVVFGEIEKAPESHQRVGLLLYLLLVITIIPLYARIYSPRRPLPKRGT